MKKYSAFGVAIALAAMLALTGTARAYVILGQNAGNLIGGDLTDPENDGAADADVNYNATFLADHENGFGGGEFAFNVFDNQVGGGNAKWCCGTNPAGLPPAHWVQATFDQPYLLTHFTVTSSNDTPGRDPRVWQVLGSNNGIDFDVIYSRNNTSTAVWTQRNQVIRFNDGGADFVTQTVGYTTFRLSTDKTGLTSGAYFALNEIEFFGTVVPEPVTVLTVAALGGLVIRRRRR